MSDNITKNKLNLLFEQIDSLKKRISKLEKKVFLDNNIGINPSTEEMNSQHFDESIAPEVAEESLLESNIGEYGLAWFGNIVLLFGGIFLHLFIQSKGKPMLAALIGFAFVASMILVSKKMEKSFTFLSAIFRLFAKILLFYVIIKLHFFTAYPIIANRYIGIGLLLIPVIYQIYLSLKLKSEKHSQLGLLFLIITAVISNETHIYLPLLTLASAGSFYLMFRFGWSKTLLLTLNLVYFSFLVWVMGNPFVTSTFKVVSSSQFSEYYLMIIAALFSTVFLIKQNRLFPKSSVFSILILNGMGFTFLLVLLTFLFFQNSYQVLFASISIFCIIYSIVLKKYSLWKYSPALYAVYGFVAISITFYGVFKIPMIFLTLTLQSLLVLSMALWFRSKIIIVMNTIMFVVLAILYFGFFDSVNIINFSFPIVAAISARIIHWQNDRLTLKTQFIRNIYLLILFVTMLYALKKALPGEYITLSWSIAALLYFVLSILLHLVKYRYLAIATLGVASIYLFFVDLATIDVVYRIIAFLVLAIISIGISIFYVIKARKKE